MGAVFAVPSVKFVNLQYGDCAAELAAAKESLGVTIHTWPDVNPLADLDDFAAQIAELDLVISVDSATVHIAGRSAFRSGRLLHFAANWRWLLDRDDTPWYAPMRLARQPEFGRWDPVFESVAESLGLLATSRASKTLSERSAVLSRLVVPQHMLDLPSAQWTVHVATVGRSASRGRASEIPADLETRQLPPFLAGGRGDSESRTGRRTAKARRADHSRRRLRIRKTDVALDERLSGRIRRPWVRHQ